MTRKRSGAKPAPRRAAAPDSGPAAGEARPAPDPDAPITGVASGSLGTAANLDDTQVMRTADLERAAAESALPAWLTNDPPPLPPVEEHLPATARARRRARRTPGTCSRASESSRRDALARAWTAAAGPPRSLARPPARCSCSSSAPRCSGPSGRIGTNPAAGGPPFADATQAPLATPTAEPKKGKGEACHGKGNDCKD